MKATLMTPEKLQARMGARLRNEKKKAEWAQGEYLDVLTEIHAIRRVAGRETQYLRLPEELWNRISAIKPYLDDSKIRRLNHETGVIE